MRLWSLALVREAREGATLTSLWSDAAPPPSLSEALLTSKEPSVP
jgi:hypothetical protein